MAEVMNQLTDIDGVGAKKMLGSRKTGTSRRDFPGPRTSDPNSKAKLQTLLPPERH